MKYLYLIIMIISLGHFKSQEISGFIKDTNNNAISRANVTLLNPKEDVVKFAITDNSGSFTLDNVAPGNYSLLVSSLGFQNKTFQIQLTNKQRIQENYILNNTSSTEIKEVIINYNPIKIKKDTIEINAANYTSGTDNTVEDLLKNIPGINIDDNGTIKIGNQEVEKIMVENDDFFEKGYKLLSKNMPSNEIQKIQIIQHYSSNKLLKGIENSDKIALNLTLKDDAKRRWFGNVKLASSAYNESFYETKVNLMNFGKKNKFYFFASANNIGTDVTGDIDNLINPEIGQDFLTKSEDISIPNLITIPTFQSNFKKTRTNFNNDKILSLNAILNPSAKLKLKIITFYNFTDEIFNQNIKQQYLVDNLNFLNYEDEEQVKKRSTFFTKWDASYDISPRQNVTYMGKISFWNQDFSNNSIFNSLPVLQKIGQQSALLNNNITYTNKFLDNKILISTVNWHLEDSPTSSVSNRYFYQDLFGFSNTTNTEQSVKSKLKYLSVTAHYLDKKKNGDLLEFFLSNENRKDDLKSAFMLYEGNQNIFSPYVNNLIYSVNDFQFLGKYTAKFDMLNVFAQIENHLLNNTKNDFDQKSSKTNFFVNSKIGAKLVFDHQQLSISGYINRKNLDVVDIVPNYMETDFRNFYKGINEFSQIKSSGMNLIYTYGSWSDQVFVTTIFSYTKYFDFLSSNIILNQNYTLSQEALVKGNAQLFFQAEANYFIKSFATNTKLSFGRTQNKFADQVNSSLSRNVKQTNDNINLEFKSGWRKGFNFNTGTKWNFNSIKTTDATNFSNKFYFSNYYTYLNFYLKIGKRIITSLLNERYDLTNASKTTNSYYFSDLSLQYSFPDKKKILSLRANNIFNTNKFENTTIDDLSTTQTDYKLLP